MIKSERQYKQAMRSMIRRVQAAEHVDDIYKWVLSIDEAEILADCVKAGYVIGSVGTDEKPYRTMDGKMHPEIYGTALTPKGIAFLRPQRAELKSNIALAASVGAALISLFALLVSLLSNIDKIVSNWEILRSLF